MERLYSSLYRLTVSHTKRIYYRTRMIIEPMVWEILNMLWEILEMMFMEIIFVIHIRPVIHM